jgi:hypothetical protein
VRQWVAGGGRLLDEGDLFGGLVPLEMVRLRDTWPRLQARYPRDFAPRPGVR